MESAKKYLLGMTLGELKEVAKSLGMPAFTGGQIAKWLYTQHVKSIDEMTNISKANREKLAAEYAIGCKEPIDAQHSKDEPSNISSQLIMVSLLKRCIYQMKTVPHSAFLHKWGVR